MPSICPLARVSIFKTSFSKDSLETAIITLYPFSVENFSILLITIEKKW